MTRLAFVNVFLLQWFGVRLARWEDTPKPITARVRVSQKGGRVISDRRVAVMPTTTAKGFALLVGVLPLSGWRGDYIGPAKFVRLTGPMKHK